MASQAAQVGTKVTRTRIFAYVFVWPSLRGSRRARLLSLRGHVGAGFACPTTQSPGEVYQPRKAHGLDETSVV